jgi:hypothetical protein
MSGRRLEYVLCWFSSGCCPLCGDELVDPVNGFTLCLMESGRVSRLCANCIEVNAPEIPPILDALGQEHPAGVQQILEHVPHGKRWGTVDGEPCVHIGLYMEDGVTKKDWS